MDNNNGTIGDIRKRVIPIVIKYGINTFSLFGSYARNEANENSDLDFVMDKGDLKGLQYVSLVQDLEDEFKKGLQYVSLVQDLEDEFNCHVDVVSKGSSNKKFLEAISKEEVLLYERER